MKKALSRKLTAMKGDKGAKLVFDEDGNAHPVYELDDEETFLKEGPSKVHSEFLSTEREKMTKADEIDKGVVKDKRAEKKRRRKELERQLEEDSDDSEGPYVATLGASNSPDENDKNDEEVPDLENDLEDSEGEDDIQPEKKKQKKWFESEKYKERDSKDAGVFEIEQPETIDDLEALAAKLMD